MQMFVPDCLELCPGDNYQHTFSHHHNYHQICSRYVPNQMAPLTIMLSFILAIAANLPRFFELQVILMMTMTRIMILIMIIMMTMTIVIAFAIAAILPRFFWAWGDFHDDFDLINKYEQVRYWRLSILCFKTYFLFKKKTF